MFGSGKINDDAVKLKTHIDMALNKYGNLPIKQLAEVLKNEKENTETIFDCSIDGKKPHRTIYFRYKELADSFSFMFLESIDNGNKSSLQVIGHGKYQNFALSASKGDWTCCTMDGGYHRTTLKAKRLVGFMVRMFGVRDNTELMNMGRR